jgi:methionyl-tRNA formyltransferase
MKISILCSDSKHPIVPWLERWCSRHAKSHDVELVHQKDKLSGGDILFLISASIILRSEERERYAACLVIHASDLPEGRGWSPWVWQILEGQQRIVVTLLEAAEPVDTGRIWTQQEMRLEGHELFNEICSQLFSTELSLMDFAVTNFGTVVPRPQGHAPTSYYRRRTPEDSRLDPKQSLQDQFDLLRVCDENRYPAFFELRGYRYVVSIRKQGESKNG